MKYEIHNHWSGEVQFTAEIDCAADAPARVKLGLVVRRACKAGADLDGADLTGADLRGADLTGASLAYANLYGADLYGASLTYADLTGANLTHADLTHADLRGANLTGANLTHADLYGANLYGANLTGADLYGANLTHADLYGANLYGANLAGANLRDVRNDLWDVLLRAPHEVEGLLAKLRAGEIAGTVYDGDCACLVGTIANVRHADYHDLGNGLKPDSDRPAERWFLAIREGDTPETSAVAKITEGWIVEFLNLARSFA